VAGSALFHVKISKKKDNRRQGQNVQQGAKVVSKKSGTLAGIGF
jgi:hypothetical protein